MVRGYDYAKHEEENLTHWGLKQIPKALIYQGLSRLRKGEKFTFNTESYSYCLDRYNAAFFCERAIEIPIFTRLIARLPASEVLEVGNVLPHYVKVKHQILDKYEKGERIINQDVTRYSSSKRYRMILCISTLEHVGWDERPRQEQKIYTAISHLKKLLVPGGELWASWPIGYHPQADIIAREIQPFRQVYYFKRISWINRWRQADYEDVANLSYGKPYLSGNGLVIASFTSQNR